MKKAIAFTLLAVLTVTGCKVSIGNPMAAPAAPEKPITFSGTGPMNTAPFMLNGGDYYATVGDLPCPVNTFILYDEDHRGEWVEQSTHVYGIRPGRYYWKVITGVTGRCSWSVTIEPQP